MPSSHLLFLLAALTRRFAGKYLPPNLLRGFKPRWILSTLFNRLPEKFFSNGTNIVCRPAVNPLLHETAIWK